MYLLPLLIALPLGIPDVFAQTQITVSENQPCFMPDYDPDGDGVYEWENVSSVTSMWVDCGADGDFVDFALLPWEWITGGWFSVILVSMFVLISYVKYQNFMYPALIGVMFIPISYALFPQTWLQYVLVLLAVGIGGLVITMLLRNTRE